MEIFDIDNSIANGIKKDIEKKNRKTSDLLMAKYYSYVIFIMRIYWKEKYVIDYFKLSVLS